MRKGIWSAAAAFVVLVSGTGLFMSRALAANGSVGIEDKELGSAHFVPAEITITPGASVTWHNGGQYDHTITSDTGAFDQPLASGKDVTIPFPTAGDFKYHCTPHPWMTGTIHVAGGSTVTSAATATTTTTRAGASTTTTRAGASSTTTTTAAGATTTTTAAGGATTTTTTTAAGGATTTTTPASAGDAASTTTTTASAASTASGGEQAAGSKGSGHRKSDTGDSSPVGIAFAAVGTLLLGGVAAKLLASKGH